MHIVSLKGVRWVSSLMWLKTDSRGKIRQLERFVFVSAGWSGLVCGCVGSRAEQTWEIRTPPFRNLQLGQLKLTVKFRIRACFLCPLPFCLFSVPYQIKTWVSSLILFPAWPAGSRVNPTDIRLGDVVAEKTRQYWRWLMLSEKLRTVAFFFYNFHPEYYYILLVF